MKNKISKNHHYVWRKYLSSWGINSKVWWLYNRLIKNTSTKSILFTKHFYIIGALTDADFKFIESNYLNTHNEKIMFNDFYKFVLELKNMKSSDYVINIDLIRSQIGENLTTKIENDGIKYIDRIKNRNINFFNYSNIEEMSRFLCFLFYQYFRTLKWREEFTKKLALSQSLNASNLDTYAIWSVVKFFFMFEYTQNVVISKRFYIKLLVNETNEKFLTSDQPVINLCWIDMNGSISNLRMFYPITPKLAIELTDQIQSNQIQDLSEKEVIMYNTAIVKGSRDFVIGNSSSQIQSVLEMKEKMDLEGKR